MTPQASPSGDKTGSHADDVDELLEAGEVDRVAGVQPGAVRVTAKLGFLLSAMKGMVEGEIQRVLKEKLG